MSSYDPKRDISLDKVTCPLCSGNRYAGQIPCDVCHGAKKYRLKDEWGGGMVRCSRCSEKGYLLIPCPRCKGAGTVVRWSLTEP